MHKQPFNSTPLGWWQPDGSLPESGKNAFNAALLQVSRPIFMVHHNDRLAACQRGIATIGINKPDASNALPLIGYAPALHPANFGEAAFKKAFNLRYAYVVGAMANGITSVEMVEKCARAGMIGFFGAAGLMPNEIEAAVESLQQRLGSLPFGLNLIHSPTHPELEQATVDLYLNRGVKLVSASAYLDLTAALVYYRVSGIHQDGRGNVVCPNRVIAKVSRIEVAGKFFSPPPEKILKQLISRQLISTDQAALASAVPMADALTCEADSGGHTDNRPAITLLPTILALRDELTEKYGYPEPISVGLGGGIATPDSVAAAFSMGAAYVLTGSVNQACVEAGTSETARRMLAEAAQADVTMAPSADMFELGVKVQVLKRGTMFALRAGKLYELYSRYLSYDQIPPDQRQTMERDLFRCSFHEQWEQTRDFFARRDPSQIPLAEKNPRHKMALVFRSYLGRSSNWAKTGDASRKIDYQIWCGPAMGAFNQWARGSFLEKCENRKTITVAMNLLFGAAVVMRANTLRQQAVPLHPTAGRFYPLELDEIMQLMEESI